MISTSEILALSGRCRWIAQETGIQTALGRWRRAVSSAEILERHRALRLRRWRNVDDTGSDGYADVACDRPLRYA